MDDQKKMRNKDGTFKKNELHPLWRGDNASYSSVHKWIVRYYGRADKCENNPKHIGRFEWANLDKKYTRDISKWRKLCKQCHTDLDMTADWRTNIAEAQRKRLSKKVVQLNLVGEVIAEYSSGLIAAKSINGDSSCITKVIKGKRKSHKGFIFIYG